MNRSRCEQHTELLKNRRAVQPHEDIYAVVCVCTYHSLMHTYDWPVGKIALTFYFKGNLLDSFQIDTSSTDVRNTVQLHPMYE